MEWIRIIFWIAISTGAWVCNAIDSTTCIALKLKGSSDVQYFRNGEVENSYGKYYAVLTRFDGTTIRFENSGIDELKDVPLTESIRNQIDQEEISRKKDIKTSTGKLSWAPVQSRTKPKKSTRRKKPESAIRISPQKVDISCGLPDPLTIDNGYFEDQIMLRLIQATDLRNQASEEMQRSMQPIRVFRGGMWCTNFPLPNDVKITTLLEQADQLDEEALEIYQDYMKEKVIPGYSDDNPGLPALSDNPYFNKNICAKRKLIVRLRAEADLWEQRYRCMVSNNESVAAYAAMSRVESLRQEASANEAEARRMEEMFALNVPPALSNSQD
jgi:hypothetical protein